MIIITLTLHNTYLLLTQFSIMQGLVVTLLQEKIVSKLPADSIQIIHNPRHQASNVAMAIAEIPQS